MAEAKPPQDRGWAYMIVLGAHLVNFLLIGCFKSLGILFVEFQMTFQSSAAMTAVMIGLIGGSMSLMAPMATAVGERIGHRSVIICGGLLCATGCFLTAFAPDIYFTVAIFGGLMGLGYGCQLSPAMVMVGKYFIQRRSLANGLAFAGGSMGTLLIPLLMRYVTDLYTFRGALMILAGCMLHMCVGGALMRPITAYRFYQSKTKVVSPSISPKKPGRWCELCRQNHPGAINGDAMSDTGQGLPSLAETTISMDDIRHKCQQGKRNQVKGSLSLCSLRGDSKSVRSFHRSLISLPVCECTCHKLDPYDASHIYASTGSLYFVPLQDTPSSIRDIQSALRLAEVNEEANEEPKDGTFCEAFKASFSCCIKSKENIRPLFDWSIFKNILYMSYAIGVTVGNAGYVNCFLFLPPYAADLGLTKKTASILLAVGGVCDLVGRIFGGWFADLNLIKRYNLMGICMMITSGTVLFCPFFPSIYSISAIIIVCGLFGGFYIALMAVVLVDHIGLSGMPNAFALMVMMMGLFNSFIPSFLGFMKDLCGGYGPVFQLCGSLMLLASMLFFSAPMARNLENKRVEKKSTAPLTQNT